MSDISIRYQTGVSQNLEKRFAHRAAGMLPSEIRSLFAVAPSTYHCWFWWVARHRFI